MLQLHEEGALDENQESWFVWPRPREEFYDLEKDPHEMCNLINDPAYRKYIDRLRKVYRQWERKYWQCRPLTEPEIVQTMWPDGVQPLVSAPQIVQRGAGQAGVFHSWSLLCLSVEWSGTEWRETLESIC